MPKDAIKEIVKTNQMLFIYNRKDFQTNTFGPERFKQFSKIDWITLSQSQQLLPYTIQTSSIEANDDPMPSFGKSIPEEEYYNLERISSVPFYDNPLLIGGIIVQMGFDQLKLVRQVRTYEDWITYVGGFMKSMTTFFGVLVPLISVWTLEKYLTSKLFYRYNKSEEKQNFDGMNKKEFQFSKAR